MPRVGLTTSEKQAVIQAIGEVLAGDGRAWQVPAWQALQTAQDKLAASLRPTEETAP